jgi:hypothetical protein
MTMAERGRDRRASALETLPALISEEHPDQAVLTGPRYACRELLALDAAETSTDIHRAPYCFNTLNMA